MSVFTQWLNPITGILTWEEKHHDYDYHQEIARSAFADMLHDEERNKKYHAALKSAIDKKHRNGEEANVLDIGTGTGLLAMMAAKYGADTVNACEAFRPMAKCAAKIIRENGLEDKIKLIHKPSLELTVGKDGDLPKRANILVAEVFDTELIGEGALSTFRHARLELLEENSIVVPSKGTVWVQVIESDTVRAWNKINRIQDRDDGRVLFETNSCLDSCSGASNVHDLQLSRIPPNSFTPLLPPQPIFHFDWSGKVPLLFDESVSLPVTPIATGSADAVFMWWDLQMDTEGQNMLSCAPVWEHPSVTSDMKKGVDLDVLARKIPWRDHWMQAIYYLPVKTPLTEGSEVSLIGCHDEYSLWFHVSNDQKLKPEDFERPFCKCCIHVAYSRTRIGQLNDKCRNDKYIEVLKKKINSDSSCLCISDGSLLGIIAAKLGAKKVIIFEPNSLSRKSMETLVNANGLSTKVQIIDSLQNFPKQEEVNLIIGEPYFVTSILPWDNLRFWYLVSEYFPDVPKFPISAKIRAVPMEFKDLQKIRQPIGVCESFDISIFDEFVQDSSEKSDSLIEAQPLWEYFGRALGPIFDVASFDLTIDVKSQNPISVLSSTRFEVDGLCNGVAVWVDWKLDDDVIIHSGPQQSFQPGAPVSWDPHSKQGVQLFRKNKRVKCSDQLCWSFDFIPQEGTIKLNFEMDKAPEC